MARALGVYSIGVYLGAGALDAQVAFVHQVGRGHPERTRRTHIGVLVVAHVEHVARVGRLVQARQLEQALRLADAVIR